MKKDKFIIIPENQPIEVEVKDSFDNVILRFTANDCSFIMKEEDSIGFNGKTRKRIKFSGSTI